MYSTYDTITVGTEGIERGGGRLCWWGESARPGRVLLGISLTEEETRAERARADGFSKKFVARARGLVVVCSDVFFAGIGVFASKDDTRPSTPKKVKPFPLRENAGGGVVDIFIPRISLLFSLDNINSKIRFSLDCHDGRCSFFTCCWYREWKKGYQCAPFPPVSVSAWLVKTRRAPSRHSRDVRVYGHRTAAMHKLSTPPPPYVKIESRTHIVGERKYTRRNGMR